jgi:hypothetical protein
LNKHSQLLADHALKDNKTKNTRFLKIKNKTKRNRKTTQKNENEENSLDGCSRGP